LSYTKTDLFMAQLFSRFPLAPLFQRGFLAILSTLIVAAPALAAQPGRITGGPGGYLSGLKLGLVAFVFFIWVKLADWMNRDAIKIGELTGMKPQIWNPINLGSQLVGFFTAISVPIFWVGFPIYLLISLTPWLIYFFMRRSAVKNDTSIQQRIASKGESPLEMAQLEQDMGFDLDFTGAGSDSTQQQANLIRARQHEAFVSMKDVLADCMSKRADTLVIDYTKTQAAPQILVDGMWHKLPPMEREFADGILVSLKHLAGLNPAERRAQQQGMFKTKSEYGKIEVDLTSTGVQTGERVQLLFIADKKSQLPLKKLGMLPAMQNTFLPAINQPGICVVSAPSGQGLTASWQGLLLSADRLARDCIALVNDRNEEESTIENIVIKKYAMTEGSQATELSTILLTRPDAMAVPEVAAKDVMDQLTAAIKKEKMSVWLQVQASSTAEALLRTYANCTERADFADTVQHVTCQRLARRLCDSCKQEIRVQPKLIQQLGGDPKKQQTLFRPWQLPPPDQRVDEKGEPIEFPPCKTCGGLGHIGRIGIFELLSVNDAVRDVMKKKPQVAAIDEVAKKSGAKVPMTVAAYKLVLLGVLSLPEAQRALKQK